MRATCRFLGAVGLVLAVILLAGLSLEGRQGVPEGSADDNVSPSGPGGALVVLSTLDMSSFQATIAVVRNSGGEVPQAYPPNAFVATLSPDVEVALRQHPAVAAIHTGVVDPASLRALGGQAETVAHIWNTVFQGIPDPIAAAAPSGPPPELKGPDSFIPPPEPPGVRTAPGAPTSTQTSEFMAGTVVYSVVFVESSGGTGNCSPPDPQTENWDSGRQATVLSEISAGLGFWTTRLNRPSPLTFMLDNQGAQPTSCEPITWSSDDEGLWIADVLKAMGRSGATPSNYWYEARAFADSRRTALGADWGYVIFVVDSLYDADGEFSDGYFAYAYLNGPFMVMTYDNDGWGIGRMNLVTAHETGHIHGAEDEYAASGCSTADSWGYLNAANTSCNNGGNISDISIMGEAWEQEHPAVDVSTSARDALGWRNPTGSPAVVDVVRTATVSLTPYTPDPTSDNTPTYSALAGNTPFPPEGPRIYKGIDYGTASPVTVSRVAAAEWNLDGGAFTSAGLSPSDGAFDEESEPYTFTPPSPVSVGPHTFGTRSINNFGHQSGIDTDDLTITTGDGANTFDVTPVDSGLVGIDGTFTVDINLVDENGGTELAYVVAQFQLEWTDADVDYVSDTPGPLLPVPGVPIITTGDPPGTEQIVAAAAQAAPGNQAGLLWSVTLKCAASSTGPDQNFDGLPDTALYLVSIPTDPVNGTATALAPGGPQPAVLEDGYVTCAALADLEIDKVADKIEAPTLDTITYTAALHNAGPDASPYVLFFDLVPTSQNVQGTDPGQIGNPVAVVVAPPGVSMTINGSLAVPPPCIWFGRTTLLGPPQDNVVMCDFSGVVLGFPQMTLQLHDEIILTILADIYDLAAAGKTSVNQAVALDLGVMLGLPGASIDPVVGGDCPLPEADADCAWVDILPANVTITKDGPPEVRQGDTWSYDITITSAGPSAAIDVEVTDVLPADASYQDNLIVSCVGTGSLMTSATEPAIGELGGTLVVTVDEMDVGDTCTITFDVRDEGPIGPERENYNSAEVCWPDPLCNMSDIVTTVKVPPWSITVLKLNDLTFEPLAGVPITLHLGSSCDFPITTKETDASGIVDFTGLLPGMHSVEETVLPGWLPDGPTCQDVDLTDPPPPPPPCPQVPDLPYPDPGCDEFDSGAQINLDLAPIGGGSVTVTLNGLTKVERKNSGLGTDVVQTEIISMVLTGSSPTLGAMTVFESPTLDSVGLFAEQTDTTPHLDFPADSFFDVFIVVEVDVDSNGVPDLVLHNEEPMRLECVIDGIPPILCMYQPPIADPIPLLDELGMLRAYIVHAAHIPLPSGEVLVVFSNVPACTPPFTVISDGDTDCDGAPDAAELGDNPFACGTRNPDNPWDFYDVPAPTIHNGGDMNRPSPGKGGRNTAINVTGDVLAVLEYSGTGAPPRTNCNSGPDNIPGNEDDRCYTDDKDEDGNWDGLAYDRKPGFEAVPPHAWSDAPNGAITITSDVLLVLAQNGSGCP